MSSQLTIQWVGDIALTGGLLGAINHTGLEEGARLVAHELGAADLRIGNWEAPLIGNEGVTQRKKIAVHTDEATAGKVQVLGLTAALLANNHALDCMASGLARTMAFLHSSGVATVGAGLTAEEAIRPLVREVRDTQVVLLAYVDRETNPHPPSEMHSLLNYLQPDRVLDEVSQWAARGAVVLVHFHWGGDFLPVPSPEQRRLARRVIDAGAAVIVGYHPHRLQGYERYRHGWVFYSLGNLIAGDIYPWPRFTYPTAAVICEFHDRTIVNVRLKYFVSRSGIVLADTKGSGARSHKRLNELFASSGPQYAKIWSRAVAHDYAITRPLHYLRRHPNPLNLLRSLERRHFTEYGALLRQLVRGKRPRKAAD